MKSDVEPTALQVRPKFLGPSIGKFRKVLSDGALPALTKDSTGAVLGTCVVHAHRTSDDAKVDSVVSGADGVYEASVYDDAAYYVVAYKAGSPDLAGTTVNTLIGH